jgi:hypothetical protein
MKNSDRMNRFQNPFNADSQSLFNLPLNGKILRGRVILTGSIVLSNVTAQGTAKGEGGPVNLIDRVILHANPAPGSRYPGGEIVFCTPRSLLRVAQRYHFGKFVAEQAGSTLGAGAAGTYPIYLSIPIYFADPTLKSGFLTSLNADPTAYQSLQVEVRTADIGACFSGWAGDVDYSNLQVQWEDARENTANDSYVVWQEDHRLYIPNSNKRAVDLVMPSDERAFTDWLLLEEQSVQQNLASTLLNRVTLNGTALNYDLYKKDILQAMIDNRQYDPSQNLAGINFINFTDGLIGGAVAASGLQNLFDLNNVSGANEDDLLIYTRGLVSPVNPNFNQAPKNS